MRARVCAIVILLCGCAPSEIGPQVGEGIGLGDFHGRWVVINYWAIWCGPCRREIPELNALQRAHEGALQVLGVNFDNPPAEVNRAQADELGIDFPVLESDPGPSLGATPPNVLPVTLIVAPDGTLAHELVGPQTRESLEAIIFGQR